jgi:hypothetical protein
MSFGEEPSQERDQRRLDPDQVQATMQQVHEHLQVGMLQSQALQEEGANRGRILAPNMHVGSKVWLDARYIRTTRPTRKLDRKCLGPCWGE